MLTPILAQASAAGADRQVSEVIIYCAIVVGALIVLAVIVAVVRAWFARGVESGSSTAFTLGELRRLHQAGQLSDEEFEKAKQGIIGLAGGTSRSPAKPAAPPAKPSSPPNSTPPPASKGE